MDKNCLSCSLSSSLRQPFQLPHIALQTFKGPYTALFRPCKTCDHATTLEMFCSDLWRLLHESSEIDPLTGEPIVLLQHNQTASGVATIQSRHVVLFKGQYEAMQGPFEGYVRLFEAKSREHFLFLKQHVCNKQGLTADLKLLMGSKRCGRLVAFVLSYCHNSYLNLPWCRVMTKHPQKLNIIKLTCIKV